MNISFLLEPAPILHAARACFASGSVPQLPRAAHVPPTERLKAAYDVVIIGAGGHGLAAAYYLARDHGITNVAVLEKGYIGGGNTGRNTTIIRSNYLTPEGVAFYDESVRLWQDLAEDFDLNLFYSTRGHFTLAHTDSAVRTMRWRAEVNKHLGRGERAGRAGGSAGSLSADGHDLRRSRAGARRAVTTSPERSRATMRWPGAMGAAPTGAAWRFTSRPKCSGIDVKDGRVAGVRTSRGNISTRKGAVRGGRLHAARARHGGHALADLRSIRCRRW